MSRTADYAIQGFIYQFIITLQELLKTTDDNAEVIVEGIIEDINVITPAGTEAIQCKYHESKDKYTLSCIYKPVLEMMCHYSKNSDSKIKYRLYAHFPNEKIGAKEKLTPEQIEKILATTSNEFIKIKADLADFTDILGFIDSFEMEFGESLAEEEKKTIDLLIKEGGFSKEDAIDIFYPNAIHRIAELSTKHNFTEKRIRKVDFLSVLHEKKQTAITRWTRGLTSHKKLFEKRRNQIHDILTVNHRVRALIIDSSYVHDFDSKIVNLIEDYIDKYNSKSKLNKCPLFSLICDKSTIDSVWTRLYSKGITVERGVVGEQFNVERFLREPMYSKDKSEFKVRLCLHDTEFSDILAEIKLDDLFIISDKEFDSLNVSIDTNIERIETKEINEIKYLLSLIKTL